MGIILCSPKTEDPSYVMYTPFCLFYGRYMLQSWRERNYLPAVGYLLPIMYVSGVHNDLFFPKLIWKQLEFSMITKPYGGMIAWTALFIPMARLAGEQLRAVRFRFAG
jgi:hypothetical protein